MRTWIRHFRSVRVRKQIWFQSFSFISKIGSIHRYENHNFIIHSTCHHTLQVTGTSPLLSFGSCNVISTKYVCTHSAFLWSLTEKVPYLHMSREYYQVLFDVPGWSGVDPYNFLTKKLRFTLYFFWLWMNSFKRDRKIGWHGNPTKLEKVKKKDYEGIPSKEIEKLDEMEILQN